jgi:hypothetical protein
MSTSGMAWAGGVVVIFYVGAGDGFSPDVLGDKKVR